MSVTVPSGGAGQPLGADHLTAHQLLANAVNSGRVLPAGGTTGQVLGKTSNADFATTWINQAGGGNGGEPGPQGPEGLSVWTTATQLNDSANTTGVNPVAVAGRTVQVGDLVLSSHASSLGFYGRVTAVASQASVTVAYVASIRGATGTKGDPGDKGDPGPQGPPGEWEALTQAAYDQLDPPDPNVLYVIVSGA